MKGLEPLRKLRIRQQRLAGQIRAGANQRDFQVICEKANDIEEDPLLPIGPSQHWRGSHR